MSDTFPARRVSSMILAAPFLAFFQEISLRELKRLVVFRVGRNEGDCVSALYNGHSLFPFSYCTLS